MRSDDALLQAWERTLARKSRAPAVFHPDASVSRTFADIEAGSLEYAQQLDRYHSGTVLGVQIGNHPDWPALLLACLRQGVVVLPLEQSISLAQRDTALQICQAAAIATLSGSGTNIEFVCCQRHGEKQWGERQPSLLKLTSGTTAAPRAVRFRSEQLVADCQQICATMQITEDDVNFGVIPVSHSYGFSNLITPLLVQGVPLVLSRDRLPRAVFDDIARSGATVFPGMPLFYQTFCEMSEVPPLPNLRLCISAGAPLNVGLAKRFYDKFNLSLHSFYGSSECGGICYDRDGTLFEEGYVGPSLDNVQVELVDGEQAPTQVRVRSAAVGDGYFPEPDEAKLGGGVFVPDDLLVRSGSGLRIVGRSSDIINVAGKKVNPAEIEEQLLRFEGVRSAVAFGRKSGQRNEEIVACVVADAQMTEADLLEFCRSRLSGWQVPRRIFFVETLPLNERGKISRRHLAARFTS